MIESETMTEIWTRHYETLNEEQRALLLLALKKMKFQGNVDADEAFDKLLLRWAIEKPVP